MTYMLRVQSGKLTIEDVRKDVEKLLAASNRVNDMTKIRAKCWLYHSESRTKNGNQPFTFNTYTHHLNKQIYLCYIEHDLIDCTDLGGKEKAIKIVEKWYS